MLKFWFMISEQDPQLSSPKALIAVPQIQWKVVHDMYMYIRILGKIIQWKPQQQIFDACFISLG